MSSDDDYNNDIVDSDGEVLDDEDYYGNNQGNEEENQESHNEEEAIREELEEMELGKLLKAKIKLEKEKKFSHSHKNKPNKRKLDEQFEKVNKDKSKKEPKEFSALIKPKKVLEFKTANTDNKPLRRDPRFDELSGTLKPEMYKKNYEFVKEKATDYLNKISKIKKQKEKGKLKLEEDEYNLMKNQINFVKGWVKNKEFESTQEGVKKQFKDENKERKDKGMNPVYVKDSVMKKLALQAQMNKRGEKDTKNFLKRKKHREMVKIRKQELK